jgi:hypothetical protein
MAQALAQGRSIMALRGACLAGRHKLSAPFSSLFPA